MPDCTGREIEWISGFDKRPQGKRLPWQPSNPDLDHGTPSAVQRVTDLHTRIITHTERWDCGTVSLFLEELSKVLTTLIFSVW